MNELGAEVVVARDVVQEEERDQQVVRRPIPACLERLLRREQLVRQAHRAVCLIVSQLNASSHANRGDFFRPIRRSRGKTLSAV